MNLVFVRYIVPAKTNIASVCVVMSPIAHFQALLAHVIYKNIWQIDTRESGRNTQSAWSGHFLGNAWVKRYKEAIN